MNRFINGITRLINGITRRINGWGPNVAAHAGARDYEKVVSVDNIIESGLGGDMIVLSNVLETCIELNKFLNDDAMQTF